MAKSTHLLLFLVLGIVSCLGMGGVIKGVLGQVSQLRPDYYNASCPLVEQIVQSGMRSHFQQSPANAAHILRLQFHDCSVTGCDASLLLPGNQSEQAALPNLTLRGFDVIGDIKAQVEAICPETVSCADIMALAARDAVNLTGGPSFTVSLGRYDSLVSGGVNVDLLSPDVTVVEALSYFQQLGLDATDLVVLIGAHTIGVAHCISFSDRLYNFNNTGKPDPSLNLAYLKTLQQNCPQNSPPANFTVPLDYETEFVFDNKLYSDLVNHRGILSLDEEIFTSNLTTGTVNRLLLNQTLFFEMFAASMIRMGLVGVRNSTNGEIRTNCSVVGTLSPSSSPAPAPAPLPTSADSPVGPPIAPPPTSNADSSGSAQIAPASADSEAGAPPPTSGA